MMIMRRLLPTTIRAQMVVIIVVAIVVVVNAGSLLELLEDKAHPISGDTLVARAETMAYLLNASPPERHMDLLAAANRAGIEVILIEQQSLLTLNEAESPENALDWLASWLFHADYGEPAPGTEIIRYHGNPAIRVPLAEHDSLIYFPPPTTFAVHDYTTRYTYYFLSFVTFVGLFSIFGVRAITAPLRSLVQELASTRAFLEKDIPLEERGSREIVELTRVLNDLKLRIKEMMAGQTRMIRAVSHDLRTPLTRIRLRSERIDNEELRAQIIADVGKVDMLINATLDYIRNDRDNEQPERTDLASMLETIVADYSDLGSDITYDGPSRLIWTVQPTAFARAIVNLCDNGLKFGSRVIVSLRETDTGPEIRIGDNGPGIPEDVRNRVLEPFFKLDAARTSEHFPTGFGLGLSIVDDIIQNHDGTVSFHDNEPHGLVVVLTLTTAAKNSKS